MGGVCPQITGSEIRNAKAKCAYKFVGVLLAVRILRNASNPGSARIAFFVIENFLKALGDFDWRSRKVQSWIQHVRNDTPPASNTPVHIRPVGTMKTEKE
jgi:hypothetical protein